MLPELVMAKIFLVGEPVEVCLSVKEVASVVGAIVFVPSVTAESLKTQSAQIPAPLDEIQERFPEPSFFKSVLEPP